MKRFINRSIEAYFLAHPVHTICTKTVCLSVCLSVLRCGVRQGGVKSPVLFFCSMSMMFITKLEDSNLGCYVGDTYTGCIMHADNIVLIAALLTMLIAKDD